MDATERQVIDELFGKVQMAESQTGPRDSQAEAYIREQVGKQPAAPYYMAQAIVIQEQALKASQARIEELEQQATQQSSGGGFLGGLFGGSRPAVPARRGAPVIDPRIASYASPQGHHHGQRRGGFLAGAMETAMGVAGGMLLANAIGSMFAGDAAAAQPEPAPEEDAGGDFGDEEF